MAESHSCGLGSRVNSSPRARPSSKDEMSDVSRGTTLVPCFMLIMLFLLVMSRRSLFHLSTLVSCRDSISA